MLIIFYGCIKFLPFTVVGITEHVCEFVFNCFISLSLSLSLSLSDILRSLIFKLRVFSINLCAVAVDYVGEHNKCLVARELVIGNRFRTQFLTFPMLVLFDFFT